MGNAQASFEEVIRLAFESAGTDGIKQAAQIMASLGDVSEETRSKAAGLLDTIASTEKTSGAVQAFRAIGDEVLSYNRKIATAKDQVQALAAEIDRTDEPTRKQTKALADARANLSSLVAAQETQVTRLKQVKSQLDTSGISLKTFAAAERDLKKQSDDSAASIRNLVSGLQAQRNAQSRADADVKRQENNWRRVASAVEDAADAQKRNAAAAEQSGRRASEGLDQTREAAGRLKGVLAGLVAFFSFDALISGVKSILSTGDEFARFEKQLASLYGTAEKGQAAFDWVKTFTKQTPLQLADVMKAFITLKNFGVDPMNGSLQAVVDQNAKLGGETERLERITLALGQAFAKNKLQGEEMMQLVEAGVPVYQILGEVTGKTAGELQALGAAGKLGTDVLRKFVAQMGKDALGAAAAQAETLGGQFTVLKDNIQQFEDTVANSGVMAYLKDQLKALNNAISQASTDGSLKSYAQRISDTLVTIGRALKSATLFAIDHTEAIGNVVKAYAAFKIGSIAGELAVGASRFVGMTRAALDSQGAVGGVAAKASGLTKILKAIPTNVQIALAVVGFEVLKQAGDYIAQYAGEQSAAQKNLDALIKRQREARVAEARGYQQTAANLEQYRDVQLKSAAEVAQLHDRERDYYAEQLKGFNAYAEAQLKAQTRLSDAGQGSADDLNKAKAAFQGGKRAADEFTAGVRVANDALSRGLPVAAAAAQDKLKGVGQDVEAAKTRLTELFAGFQTSTITQLGDLALGIAKAGQESDVAAATIRDALGGALSQLSSQDLLKFQSAATAAMEQYQVSAQDASSVVQPLLEQGLARLGVAANQWGLSSTQASRENLSAFALVAENAEATGRTIEAAFYKALANASTIEEAQALGTAIKSAGDQGKISLDATQRAGAALENQLRAIKTALDPLNASFAELGIQSKRQLDDQVASASAALDQITEAHRRGQAAIEDVRAASDALNEKQRAAAQNSDTWQKQVVENQIKVRESTLGVKNGLTDMGDAGHDAGERVARGSERAKQATDESASSSHDAADAADRVSASTDEAADSDIHYSEAADRAARADREHAKATEAMSYSLNGLSDQLVKDLADLNRLAGIPRVWRQAWNDTMQRATDQLNQFQSQMKALEEANAQFDPMAAKIAGLRSQYKYLTDDQIRSLAQAQDTLEQNNKRAADERKRQVAEQNEAAKQREASWASSGAPGADSSSPATPDAMAGPDAHLKVELAVSSAQKEGGAPVRLSPTDIRSLANQVTDLVADRVVNRLGIRRAKANR